MNQECCSPEKPHLVTPYDGDIHWTARRGRRVEGGLISWERSPAAEFESGRFRCMQHPIHFVTNAAGIKRPAALIFDTAGILMHMNDHHGYMISIRFLDENGVEYDPDPKRNPRGQVEVKHTADTLYQECKRWQGYDYTREEILFCLRNPTSAPWLQLTSHWSQDEIDEVIAMVEKNF